MLVSEERNMFTNEAGVTEIDDRRRKEVIEVFNVKFSPGKSRFQLGIELKNDATNN